ncbi:MAG: hypothetical protein WCK98_04780 [bacterium]
MDEQNLKTKIQLVKSELLKIWQKCLKDYNDNGKLTSEQSLNYINEYEELWFDEILPLLKLANLSDDSLSDISKIEKNLKLFIADCEQYLNPASKEEILNIDKKIKLIWNSFQYESANHINNEFNLDRSLEYLGFINEVRKKDLKIALHSSDSQVVELAVRLDNKAYNVWFAINNKFKEFTSKFPIKN